MSLTRFNSKLNEFLATKTESEALNMNNIIECIKYVIEYFGNFVNLLKIKLSMITVRKLFNIRKDEFCNRLIEMQSCLQLIYKYFNNVKTINKDNLKNIFLCTQSVHCKKLFE